MNSKMKTCSNCKTEKPKTIEFFYCSFHTKCKKCERECLNEKYKEDKDHRNKLAEYRKKYRQKNKDKFVKYNKENKDKRKEYFKLYRIKNREKINKRSREMYAQKKENNS